MSGLDGLRFDADLTAWLGPVLAAAWPYLFVIVAGVLATEVWRWAGVAFGGSLSEDSPVFGWVRAVATALVAGVVAKLILEPTGSLAATPVWLRVAAAAIGLAAFLGFRRNLVLGIVAGEAALLAGWAMSG